MKKLLIVGVSGFIGESLYLHLKNRYDVYGISRRLVSLKNCSSIDLFEKRQVVDFFKAHKFDVVVNLASIMATPENVNDTELLIDNIKLTSTLSEALVNNFSGHLVNASSSAVYSNKSGTYTERSLLNPSDNSDCLYGLSKYNSEVIFKFCLRNASITLTNLRIPMVYGENMDKSRIHKVFEDELNKNNSIELRGGGERVISHISIECLCSYIEKVIAVAIPGTYNVADESIPLKKLAESMIDKFGNERSRLVFIEEGNKEKFQLDGTLLRSVLND